MKTFRLGILFALVLTLSITSGAWAVDEGQTKPRLSSNSVSSNMTVEVIPLTSGSGNIKGFICQIYPGGTLNTYPLAKLHFYVDGGAAETIDPLLVPGNADDGGTITLSAPMNVRFGSSIRVTLQKTSGSGGITCTLSWGLD